MLRILTIFSFLFIFLPFYTDAQVGITGYFSQSNSEYYQTKNNLKPFLHAGAAVHYWFRIKTRRIEFFPELGFSKGEFLEYSENNTGEFFSLKEAYQTYYFRVPARFYLLDFEGDCNCPTFSKQGTFFKKGFFVMIAPGIHMADFPVNYVDFAGGEEQTNRFNRTGTTWSIAGGLGLDIGISDAITLTPLVLIEKTGSFSLDPNPCQTCFQDAFKADFLTVSGGLSIHYRWQQ